MTPGGAAPVVVGLDASWRSDVAMEWAAGDARLRGAPVVLAHAVGREPDAAASADRLLGRARDRMAAVAPDVRVDVVSRRSDPMGLLAGLSREAGIVVVGAPDPVGRDALGGSVALGVVARSAAPVAVVRGTHGRDVPRDWPVVAGLAQSCADDPVLPVAFAAAARERRPLVAVQAWSAAAAVDAERSRRAAAMVRALAPWSAAHEGVRARVDVALDGADRALLDRSDHAAVLVVGVRRLRHPRGWDRLPLGAVLARAGPLLGLSPLEQVAAWRSRCPVVLVPP